MRQVFVVAPLRQRHSLQRFQPVENGLVGVRRFIRLSEAIPPVREKSEQGNNNKNLHGVSVHSGTSCFSGSMQNEIFTLDEQLSHCQSTSVSFEPSRVSNSYACGYLQSFPGSGSRGWTRR